MSLSAFPLVLLITLLLTACTSPQQAADKTCGCLQEVVKQWENDEKLKASLHFTECGKMQEDYKKQFSGNDLLEFETKYQECLEATIKLEGLKYLMN